MNLDSLQDFSPINTQHEAEDPRNTSLSNSWQRMFPSSIHTPKRIINQYEMNFLIAKNKMARTLDSIFSKRIRHPYQLIKQRMFVSQLSISNISDTSYVESRFINRKNRNAGPAIDILKGVFKAINQKTKVQCFTLMKARAEDYREFNYTPTESPDTNWLKREQQNEGLQSLVKVLSQKVKQSFKSFYQNAKYQLKTPIQTRTETLNQSKQLSKFKLKDTAPFDFKKNYSIKQYSIERTKDQRPILTQNNSNGVSQTLRKTGPVIQKVIQYVYILGDKSNTHHRSKSRHQSKDILTGMSYAPPPLTERRSRADFDYITSKSKKKLQSDCRTSSRNKYNCKCQDQNNHYASISRNTCKYCKLFMDDFDKPLTHRKSKFSFFSK